MKFSLFALNIYKIYTFTKIKVLSYFKHKKTTFNNNYNQKNIRERDKIINNEKTYLQQKIYYLSLLAIYI